MLVAIPPSTPSFGFFLTDFSTCAYPVGITLTSYSSPSISTKNSLGIALSGIVLIEDGSIKGSSWISPLRNLTAIAG
jgi:hypothetical protein